MHAWFEPVAIAASVITASALSGAAAYGIFAPRSRLWGATITHGAAGDPPRVALSFDDGPSHPSTDQIIDLLGDLDVRATFFVIGINAEKNPDLIRRLDAAGHLIGNHSYHHHRYGVLRGRRYWQGQLQRTADLLSGILGKCPTLFRPPMGFKNPPMFAAARATGHDLVTWNRRALDGVCTTSERIVHRLVPHTRSGDILSLHDGVEPGHRRNPEATLGALRPVVTGLKQRGFQIIRLDELLGLAPYHLLPSFA